MQSSSVKRNISMGVCGFYKIEATNTITNEKRLVADWFPNLITDIGLNEMGNRGTIMYCMVGTSTTTPNITDTTLISQIAVSGSILSTLGTASASAPYYGSQQNTYRFSAGAAAGNLSEIGVGWLQGGIYYCFSRALILDSGGLPTTITILSNEILDVTYELRAYAPASDQVFNLTLSGDSYECTLRASSVTNPSYWAPTNDLAASFVWFGTPCSAYSGPIGAVTSTPSGSTIGVSITNIAYSNNSLNKRAFAEFSLTQANYVGGIQSVSFVTRGLGSYQIGFNPAIPKDNTKTFRLDIGVTWARR